MAEESVKKNLEACVEPITLEPPVLTRLGTLAELTTGMNGASMDGGSGMTRFP